MLSSDTEGQRDFPFHGPIKAAHYLEGLEGCGSHALAGVQGAFEALGAFTAGELARQEGLLQLPLLDSWGIIIQAEDHDLLARVRLFNVLQVRDLRSVPALGLRDNSSASFDLNPTRPPTCFC